MRPHPSQPVRTGIASTRSRIGKRYMKLLVSRFIHEEHGSTALEYGLIAAGLSIAIVTVLAQIATTFSRLKATAAAAGN